MLLFRRPRRCFVIGVGKVVGREKERAEVRNEEKPRRGRRNKRMNFEKISKEKTSTLLLPRTHVDTPRPSSTLNIVSRGTTFLTAPPATSESTLSSVLGGFERGDKEQSERERRGEKGSGLKKKRKEAAKGAEEAASLRAIVFSPSSSLISPSCLLSLSRSLSLPLFSPPTPPLTSLRQLRQLVRGLAQPGALGAGRRRAHGQRVFAQHGDRLGELGNL